MQMAQLMAAAGLPGLLRQAPIVPPIVLMAQQAVL
jgi:hypothetical protein